MKNDIFDRLTGDGASVETRHRTLYRVHQRVAKSFVENRVILIGDSAHLNNPLGGFGMNSGVHDAFNLFEKLEPLLQSGKPNGGLELYDRQRRKVTHSFTQTQTIENMKFIQSGHESGAHERKRQEMLAIKQNHVLRREYLMRQSMYESLAQADAIN